MQTVGLKTWQWNNAAKTVLLLAGFPLLLVILSFAVTALFVADQAPSLAVGTRRALAALPSATAVALAISGGWFAIAWFAHQRIIDFATGARPVTRSDQPRLWNLLENLCISRGMPMPSLRIIETEALNAYASGLVPPRYAVTVTRGLLEVLDERELEAVLAHELTHIRNGDARLAVVAAVFAGILTLVPEMFFRGLRFGRVRTGGSRRGGSGGGGAALVIIAIVLMLLVWLMASMLRFALSRNREYLADAGAVELTKDADAMISALRKIEGRSSLPKVPDQLRALFLDDQKNTRGGSLWATHPPIAQRIAALVQHAGGRDPGPIALVRPEGADAPAAVSPWARPAADAKAGEAPTRGPWG